MVQIDGCEHAWFEDRGPKCSLLVYVDDATSRLMELRLAVSESTFDYFAATRSYVEKYGKPVAFYSDKASIFRVVRSEAAKGARMMQFGRQKERIRAAMRQAEDSAHTDLIPEIS